LQVLIGEKLESSRGKLRELGNGGEIEGFADKLEGQKGGGHRRGPADNQTPVKTLGPSLLDHQLLGLTLNGLAVGLTDY